jgi:hypothetical protein
MFTIPLASAQRSKKDNNRLRDPAAGDPIAMPSGHGNWARRVRRQGHTAGCLHQAQASLNVAVWPHEDYAI